jgi:hypothetical protein
VEEPGAGFVARGVGSPPVVRKIIVTVSLGDAADAHRLSEQRGRHGKIIPVP